MFNTISFLKQIICCNNIFWIIIFDLLQRMIFSVFRLLALCNCICDLHICVIHISITTPIAS